MTGPARAPGMPAMLSHLDARDILGALAVAVMVTDRDGTIVYANERLCTLTGYPPAELIGRSPRLLQTGATSARSRRQLRDAMQAGMAAETVLLNRDRDGREFWNAVAIAPLRGSDGTVTGFVASCRDVSDERARLLAMRRAALTDQLTGISNRRHFMLRARREVNRAQRYRRPLSLLVFDIDHFKQINDGHGHACGDEVIQAVVARFKLVLRGADLIARMGGDEFAVMMPETSIRAAEVVARRVCAVLRATPAETAAGSVAVTISMGVSSLDIEHRERLTDWLARADGALYAAKEAGRDCWRSG